MATSPAKHASSHRGRAWTAVCGAICVVDGLALLVCAFLTAQLSFDALIADEWRIQYDYVRSSLPAFVLTLQNGHSVAFPNLVMALNNAWFDGHSRPLVLFSLAANLTASSLLAARMWRTRGRSGVDGPMAVAIFSVLLMSFWPESWSMVFWAIGVENYLCVLGAVLAMWGIARLSEEDYRLRSRAAALAAAGAVLSTFSFGIGLCVWPAMLIALLAGRAPRRVVAACAALATVCVAGFRWGLPGNSIGMLGPPVTQMTVFVLRYLGVGLLRPVLGAFSSTVPPPERGWGPGVEVAVGAAGLLVMLAITLRAWRSEPPRRALHVFCAGLLWFVAGGGALTALARLSKTFGHVQLGLEQAVALRYGNWRTLFWQTCLVYGLSLLLGRMPLTRARRAGVLLLGLAVPAIVSANLPGHARLQAEQRSTAMRGAQSLSLDRVGREGEVWGLVPHPFWWNGREHTLAAIAALEQRRLNLFAEPWMRYPGRRLDDAFAPAGAPGQGGFRLDGSRSSPGVVALAGWSWDPFAGAAFDTLAIVLDDVVVGFGNHVPAQGTAARARLPGRGPLTALLGRGWDQAPRLLGLDNAWIGLARIPEDAVSRLRFYGIGRDGRAHPLVMEAL